MKSKLYIVDVKNGNSAIISCECGTIVIDAGIRQRLLQFLRSHEIREIATVIISHADADHFAGLIDVLLADDIAVHQVRLNADASQNSKIFDTLRLALQDSQARNRTSVETSVHSGLQPINLGPILIEVLSPTLRTALAGIGGTRDDGSQIDRHSMNAVIGVSTDSARIALLSGDVSQTALTELQESHSDIRAEILVFPHHGGHAGVGDTHAFAVSLCSSVMPNFIIFSVGSHRPNFPREEVIDAVCVHLPQATLLATGAAPALAAVIERDGVGRHKNGAGIIEWNIHEGAASLVTK